MGDWLGEEREAPARTLHDIRVHEFAENQRDFASRIGVNTATLNRWETGRSVPQFLMRHRVADALRLRVTQIIWESQSTSQQVARALQQAQRRKTSNGERRPRPQLSLG